MRSIGTLALLVGLTLAPLTATPDAPGGTFVDDDGSVHEPAIEAISVAGLAGGCDAVGPRYCPSSSLTRAQMATLLTNAFGLDTGAPDRFVDDDGSVHEPSINALADAGITAGCSAGADMFCPGDPITRGQMAAFLSRADGLPAPATNTFVDDDGSVFEPDIEAIAEAGITAGCSASQPALFCPHDRVTREQMASFLMRALELTPLVPPPRPPLADRLAADHAALMAFGVREAGTAGESEALDWLAAELLAITGNVGSEDVPLVNGRTSRNVWATIGRGSTSILLGAHADSVAGSIGADDNGSGVTVLLEMARTLVAEPPTATVTIAFFGAEERLSGYPADVHHAGSRLRTARLAGEGALPDWMVSVDMVGVGSELLAVTYLSTSTAAATELASAGTAVGVPIAIVSRGDISDHEAFALAGVPSAFLWRPDNPDWHLPTDTTIDVRLLEEDVRVVTEFVRRVGS